MSFAIWGTVTVTVCPGARCTHGRAKVRRGRFTLRLLAGHGRHLKVTVAAAARAGYRAARVTRITRL